MNDAQPVGIAAVIAATRRWIEQPYRSNMGVFGWFLFLGIVIASAALWSRALAHWRV